jgi:hypothetical protein
MSISRAFGAAKLRHGLRRIDRAKNRGPGNEDIRARFSSDLCCSLVDPSIDLNVKLEISIFPDLTSPADFFHRLGHESLAAEPRVNGHYQQKIDLGKKRQDLFERGGGADRKPGGTPFVPNRAQSFRNIHFGFDVHGHIVYERCKSFVIMIRPRNHEMRIERLGRELGDTFNDWGPKRYVINKMAIHDIEMQPIGSGLFDSNAILFQLGKVTGQNRRVHNDRVIARSCLR